MSQQNTKNNSLNLDIDQLVLISKAVEKGMEHLIYTNQELQVLFPIINKIITYYESIKRKLKIENLIKEKEQKDQQKEQNEQKEQNDQKEKTLETITEVPEEEIKTI